MESKAKLVESRKYLERARAQWDKACVDSWYPQDAASCVTNTFYAYENLMVALVLAHGRRWTPNHDAKAGLAKKFFELGVLSKDVSVCMIGLNRLRKDVSYGEPGPELDQVDLEDTVSELEEILVETDRVVATIEKDNS